MGLPDRIKRIFNATGSDHVVKAIVASALAVIVPILAFSEATVKSLVDGWLSQCLVVLETDKQSNLITVVRVYPFGKVPDTLPITFSSSEGLLSRVTLINHVEQQTTFGGSRLAVHSQAGQRCPGELCGGAVTESEKLTIRLNGFTPNYAYELRVLFKDDKPQNVLRVYVLPRESERFDCRVESASALNYFARSSTVGRPLLLLAAVPVLVLFIGWLRRSAGGGL